MSKKRLYAHVLLDRSGSMEACRDTTISAFNEYVNSLKTNPEISARISLTIFDDQSIDLIIDRQKARDVVALTKEVYVPRGMTPLNDSIAKTANAIESVPLRDEERVSFVIVTDGLENASREYSRDAVRKLLERLQAEKNWLVLYLGANQDAFAEGAARGVAAAQSMDFDVQRMPAAMSAVRRSTMAFAETASRTLAAFTPGERAAALSQRRAAVEKARTEEEAAKSAR
ncbi:MAG: VWA domain-containing protein [Rhizobiaceae bacterium]|nr:VWA domain-containing protein [Rhizobiaceae bacterium]